MFNLKDAPFDDKFVLDGPGASLAWREWLRNVTPRVNETPLAITPEEFGARGDGIHDDTSALNAALDEAAESGKIVHLNARTYLVSNNIVIQSKVTLEGNGWASIIKLAANSTLTNAGIVRIKYTGGVDYATLRNFAIDGNKANQTSGTNKNGVYIEGDYITITGLYVHDCPFYGIDPHEQNPGSGVPSTFLTIENNYLLNNGDATHENIVLDMTENSLIFGNFSVASSRHGINLTTKSRYNIVEANTILNALENGITLQSGSVLTNQSERNIIRGNYIANAGNEGIYLRDSDFNSVKGNTIRGSAHHGIRLRSSSYNVVSGNVLEENATAAGGGSNYQEIGIDDAFATYGVYSTYNSINGNTIKCNLATYGIDESSTNQNYNSITGNTVSGAVTKSIRVQGANSLAWGNTTSDGADQVIPLIQSGFGLTAPTEVFHIKHLTDKIYYRADNGTVIAKYGIAAGATTGRIGTESNHDFVVITNNLARLTFKKDQAADGIEMPADHYLLVGVFSDATRPAASNAGRVIFNTTDGNLNIDNGANWILPDGTIT